MTFSPSIEGNKVADFFPFDILCKFLEQVSIANGTKKKKQYISLFIRKWAAKYNELVGSINLIAEPLGSFFPILRLLIPSADRGRAAYGIGEPTMAKMLIKAFGLAPKGPEANRLLKKYHTSIPISLINQDLADTVYSVLQGYCAVENTCTISGIHNVLDELVSSPLHDQKLQIISRFTRIATILELKWFVRIVSRRDLSLGVGDNAILSCLHPAAPSVWRVTQDLHIVCQRIAAIDPKSALSDADVRKFEFVELFTAFKPMLCSRTNSVDEICTAYHQDFSASIDAGLCLEAKYDGERVQLHKSGANYRFWSRSGREWSGSYGACGDSSTGSLTYRLHANGSTFADRVTDCILDGEMLAFDKINNRFITKATGYDVKSAKLDDSAVMPCFVVFDILYLNGELLTEMPLCRRKRILLTIFSSFKSTCEEVSTDVENYLKDSNQVIDCDEEIKQARLLSLFVVTKQALYLGGFLLTQPTTALLSLCFDAWVGLGAEGLVAKALGSTYTPNGRAHAGWWKLKPDYVAGLCTDLDCLLVGAYTSTATTCTTRFSTFLCAIINDDVDEDGGKRRRLQSNHSPLPSFCTFCQVSSGLKRAQLESINRHLEAYWKPYDRHKINRGETEWLRVSGERPDFWVAPRHSLVLQIHAAEMTQSNTYSSGFTLRFPRVIAIREDKTWADVVCVSEIRKLYRDTKGKMIIQKTGRLSEGDSDKSDSVSDEDQAHISCTSKTAPAYDISAELMQTHWKPSTQYCCLSTGPTLPGSSVFTDMEFCLYISFRFSGPSTDLATKDDLEKAILTRSGKVVRNPGSDTTYVIADRITAKVSNLIEATSRGTGQGKEGGYDIVSVEWLILCIQANQLLPLCKDYVFAARPSTLLQLNESYQNSGNCCTNISSSCHSRDTPSFLKETFNQVAEHGGTSGIRVSGNKLFHRSSLHDYTSPLDDKSSDSTPSFFGVSIVLVGSAEPVSSQLKLVIADLRSLQALVNGPLLNVSTLLPKRVGTVTHVVVMNESAIGSSIPCVLEEIRKQTGQSDLPVAVTLAWAVDCALQKTLLPVSSYLAID